MVYKISAPHPSSHVIEIEMIADGISAEEIFFQLPSWRPGRYELGNFAKNILSWAARKPDGEILASKKVSKDCWEVNTDGSTIIHIHYSFYAAQADAGGCYLDDEQLYINPVQCCLYIPERVHEMCSLEFILPEKYQLATSLEKKSSHILFANNYHELVDSPVIASASLQHNTYHVEEKLFHIWIQGECTPDWIKIITDFRKFTAEQLKMLGDIPVDEFHFLVQALPYKFYHGVEHLKSTVLAIGPSAELMNEKLYVDFIGVASHELFHVWNVKTIRPHEMMPYDYTKENYSRLGFVYEGVTTYYGDLFLARCGVYSTEQFFAELNVRIQKHFDNYGRFNLSVADSSFDTWLDGYVPGVPNRKTSIYDEGCLIALMTDLTIRSKTNNGKSLDDVMRTLYHDFGKRKTGYTEADYISIIENFTNEGAGDFFLDYVYGTDNYESLLSGLLGHFGCELKKTNSENIFEREFGFKVTTENAVTKVSKIAPQSPSWNEGLSIGDEIYAVNEMKVEDNLNELMNSCMPGKIILSVFTMMKKTKEVLLEQSSEKYFPQYKLVLKEKQTADEQKLFGEWMRSSAQQHSSSLN